MKSNSQKKPEWIPPNHKKGLIYAVVPAPGTYPQTRQLIRRSGPHCPDFVNPQRRPAPDNAARNNLWTVPCIQATLNPAAWMERGVTARDAVRSTDAIAVMGLAPVLKGQTKEVWARNVLATLLQHCRKIGISTLTAKR